MKYRYLFLILAAAAFCACDAAKESGPDPVNPVIPPVQNPITLSEKTLSILPEEGSTVSVDVTTEGDWVLSGMTDGVKMWLGVSATEGHGNATVTFTCLETNPYDDSRMAVLVFKNDEMKVPVVIHQDGDPTRTVSLSADALSFSGPENEEITLDVITSKPWTLEGYTEEVKTWMTASPLSGEGNATITLKSLSRNMSLNDRITSLGFRIDRIHCAYVTVAQKTGITLTPSVSELEFVWDQPESKTVTIAANSDQYPWHLESAPSWVSVDTDSYTGLEKEVTISTKGENPTAAARSGEVVFAISDDVKCMVTVTQQSPVLKTIVLSWKGSGSYTKLIKGGPDSPHNNFPWLDGSTTLSSFPPFLDGKGGAVVEDNLGNYTKTGTWLFKDKNTAEFFPLEMGPATTKTASKTVRIYYHNHGNDNLRWCNTYIKIPAKAGYKLTHVKINSFNGASSKCLSLSSDKYAEQIVEGYSKVSFGKNDVFDVELTTTEPNTDYYLSSIADRWMDSFEFTYTEVR